MAGGCIYPGGCLWELEVTFVEEFSSLDIVLEIYLALDACEVSGATHQRVFAMPVELGPISCVPGGERIRRTESTACRSVGQTTDEGFRAALLVDAAGRGQNDFVRVGVPTADESPFHFDGRVDAGAVRAFVGAYEHANPRDLRVACRAGWRCRQADGHDQNGDQQ